MILTNDLDFGTLLAIGGLTTPSVIQFRTQRVLPKQVGQQLLATLRASATDLEQGALITFDPERRRLTVLPLNR